MTFLSSFKDVIDVLSMPRKPLPVILAAQQRRLFELVAHACASSPFYASRYRRTEWTRWGLAALPPVTKDEINADLDAVLADRALDGASVREFLARPQLAGRLFAGRYVALRTAGTTGRLGAVLYDRAAWRLFKLLSAARGVFGAGAGGARAALRVLSRRHRVAYLVAAGGHYSTAALSALSPPWMRIWAEERVFPITATEDSLIAGLQKFQPEIIHLYPTFADALARGQLEGRLDITPRTISTSSEPLTPETRALLARAFPRTRVSDCYGATECMVLARQCARSEDLHVNADWVIVEPVDAQLQPVAYGQPSHRVLITNLANRVMPFIRYVLDDVVTPLEPGTCACGSNLPRIRIQGRVDDTIWLAREARPPLALRPLALGSAMTRLQGLRQFQAIQTGPSSIRMRFVTEPDADRDAVGRAVVAALEHIAAHESLSDPLRVTLEPVDTIERDQVSGKIRRILSPFRPVTGACGRAGLQTAVTASTEEVVA